MITVVILLSIVAVSSATTYYVATAGNDDSNGLSWETAFATVVQGINEANYSDQIWVADGSYYPTEGSNRSESFDLKAGVGLYGGFDGNETDFNDRDWVVYETILSGDIDKDSILDSDNSYNVVNADNGDANSVIDGFTITAGYGTSGSGLTNTSGYANLYNCLFSDNYSSGSGTIFSVTGGTVNADSCIFSDNTPQALAALYSLPAAAPIPLRTAC